MDTTTVLAIATVVVNAFGIIGGLLAFGRDGADREERATALYFLARSTALFIASVVAWINPVAGWVVAVAVITVIVQLLDIPIGFYRRQIVLAILAFVGAAVIAVLLVVALPSP
jgi:hypothetical protein